MTKETCDILAFSLSLTHSVAPKPTSLFPFGSLRHTLVCDSVRVIIILVFFKYTYIHSCFPFASNTSHKKKPFEYTERAICVNFAGNAAIHSYTHTQILLCGQYSMFVHYCSVLFACAIICKLTCAYLWALGSQESDTAIRVNLNSFLNFFN